MAWKHISRNTWFSLIKWVIGVPAFVEAAALYEHWKPLVGSLIFRMPLPSSETAFWGYVGIGTIIIGIVLIGSDMISRIIASRRHLTPRQLKYRSELRDALGHILIELYHIERPDLVQFESWNAFPKPDPRPSDINNSKQFQVIENLSTALNKRNNYVNEKGPEFHGDFRSEFLSLNNQCIVMYEKVRETGFLDPDVAATEQQSTDIVKNVALVFRVRSTSDWFDIGIENGKLIDVTKHTAWRGRIKEITAHENYFHVEQGPSPVWVSIVATFDLPRNKVSCVLRKGGKRGITVGVKSSSALQRIATGWRYALSPKGSNEVIFELHRNIIIWLLSWWF